MNNAERRRKARHERMEPELSVKVRRPDGLRNVYPIRYLVGRERERFLERATSPLE